MGSPASILIGLFYLLAEQPVKTVDTNSTPVRLPDYFRFDVIYCPPPFYFQWIESIVQKNYATKEFATFQKTVAVCAKLSQTKANEE